MLERMCSSATLTTISTVGHCVEGKSNHNAKFYHDKSKDAELCDKLCLIMARFVTLEALKEVVHNMDTCANESFNNTIVWVAPKNKVYSGSQSLQN